jgi:hypothetical protein
MRRKVFSIWSVLLALVISLAVLVPGCEGEGEPTTGTIEVDATLDGDPWTGAIDYTLTPASGSPISGTSVADSFSADAGTWTCSYDGGGPDGAEFVGIAPSETQELSGGETITFTLAFEIPETDASITFVSWSIDGQQVAPGQYTVYPPTTIDTEYNVFVAGNSSEWVTVNATFKLPKHFLGEADTQTWHVANAPGSVSTSPPAQDLTHECTVNGVPTPVCVNFDVFKCEPMFFDVHISFKIRKGSNYGVNINWLGYKGSGPDDILFDTDLLGAGPWGNSNIMTSGCVYVEDDVDPANDCTGNSSTLNIIYDYLTPPP